jgi:hypothetical protein
MNVSICLDQYASNYNLNALSTNGFSIYTDLDNFTTPIAQGIPYQNLFSAPIGNCPYLLTNVPAGATQLLVIDNCTSNPTLPGATVPTSQELLIDCCYALIDIPQTPPPPFCVSCSLDFDVFSSSFVGQIIAGNLTSTCGTVTDYKIGWYKDGDYSAPEFISGYGNAFTPYQLTHPLAGNTAPYVTAGDWEGIIHDIAINGVTYSSVSGSAGGQPIPFESCFGTIVVAPLQCDNGTFPLPYTHQKEFTAAGNGATPPIIGATYVLSDTTEYFAYRFDGYTVFDELEIKFISGDPNNTGNPSLYSQPIYLEKAQIGEDVINPTIGNLQLITDNNYPKKIKNSHYKRIFTLTNISRSANPSLPDSLEIKISPNPTNNQTNWKLQMQCLDTFDCTDCLDPFPAVKISDIFLDKLCCGVLAPKITYSGSCDCSTDIWNDNLISNNPYTNVSGYTLGGSPLAAYFTPQGNPFYSSWNQFSANPSPTCLSSNTDGNSVCSLVTPNSIISYHKSITSVNGQFQGIISMSFNTSVDYLHYKNNLIAQESSLISNVGPLTLDPTLPEYYCYYSLKIPTTNIACGDGVPFVEYYISRTAYPNIIYVEDPTNNYWSITIPMPVITNNVPQNPCSSCYNSTYSLTLTMNNSSLNTSDLNVVNNYGSKLVDPFGDYYVYSTTPSSITTYFYPLSAWERNMPYYSWNTLPFVSSSNGWVNLPTLNANPCPTLVPSTMPYEQYGYLSYAGTGYKNSGFEASYIINFPNLTASSDWFQIYTGVTSSNGTFLQGGYWSPTPGAMIYEHSASIGTVYSSSYFVNGAPTLTIDSTFPNC